MLASIGVKVVPTKYVPELSVSDYDVLLLPGGAKAITVSRTTSKMLVAPMWRPPLSSTIGLSRALNTSISGYG